jgi:hypothetical protein
MAEVCVSYVDWVEEKAVEVQFPSKGAGGPPPENMLIAAWDGTHVGGLTNPAYESASPAHVDPMGGVPHPHGNPAGASPNQHVLPMGGLTHPGHVGQVDLVEVVTPVVWPATAASTPHRAGVALKIMEDIFLSI